MITSTKFNKGDVVTGEGWDFTCVIDHVNAELFPEDPIAFFVGGGFWRTSRIRLAEVSGDVGSA